MCPDFCFSIVSSTYRHIWISSLSTIFLLNLYKMFLYINLTPESIMVLVWRVLLCSFLSLLPYFVNNENGIKKNYKNRCHGKSKLRLMETYLLFNSCKAKVRPLPESCNFSIINRNVSYLDWHFLLITY